MTLAILDHDKQGSTVMNVEGGLDRKEVDPQELEDFLILGLKWLKIDFKNVKCNNANLYNYSYPLKFLKTCFSTGAVPPLAPHTIAYDIWS